MLIVTVCGCSGAKDSPLVPAEGIVTLDGKPLSGATVLFIPLEGATLQSCTGRTDATGRFRLQTMDLQKEGALAGSYKVVVSKKVNPDGTDFVPKPDEDPMLAAYKELLPRPYHDDAQSTLEITIPETGTDKIELKLSSKAR